MSSIDVLQKIRRDVGSDRAASDDRTERLRRDLVERAEVTRGQLAQLATEVGGEVATRASVLGEDFGRRTEGARTQLAQRYHELEEELPIEEVALKARITLWRAIRLGLSGLFTLPGLLVRGLGALSSAADDVSARGVDLSERGRELVAAVPPSKAERRRSRRRSAGLVLIGFLIGLVVGRLLPTGPGTRPADLASALGRDGSEAGPGAAGTGGAPPAGAGTDDDAASGDEDPGASSPDEPDPAE